MKPQIQIQTITIPQIQTQIEVFEKAKNVNLEEINQEIRPPRPARD